MNLFATSDCPCESARALDDARVVKMIAETTQMLVTAARVRGFDMPGAPRSTYEDHPVTMWVGETAANFNWAYDHLVFLHGEKFRRWPLTIAHEWYPLVGALGRVYGALSDPRLFDDVGPRTPFANCAANASLGLDFTDVEDVTAAYRLYLGERWDLAESSGRPPRWTNVPRPLWRAPPLLEAR